MRHAELFGADPELAAALASHAGCRELALCDHERAPRIAALEPQIGEDATRAIVVGGRDNGGAKGGFGGHARGSNNGILPGWV